MTPEIPRPDLVLLDLGLPHADRYRAMVRAICEFWCGAALSPLRP
ncbi:MAG TPA: hypothetical protein VFQ76_19455 [Longimicrobiaceae bacterium]|nr:hypothetical protein [Longimicrobiaceae bacterium]